MILMGAAGVPGHRPHQVKSRPAVIMEHSDWYTPILRHETMTPICAIENSELTGEKRPAIKSSSYLPHRCCKLRYVNVANIT